MAKKSNSLVPTQKVTAATLGGAFATLIVAIIEGTFHIVVDAPTAMAIATLCAFATGWVVPER